MTQPVDLTEPLQRFRKHFGQDVSGRSIFEFPASKVVKLVEQSIASNQIAPELIGDSTDLTELDKA